MIKVRSQVKKNTLKFYIKNHSKGFRVSIGIFAGSKNYRKDIGTTGTQGKKGRGYGVRRATVGKRNKSLPTNFQIAYKHVHGIGVPVRNFFKNAGDKKYWINTNYSFLKNFYRGMPRTKEVERRLANLGVTIIKKSIFDGNYTALRPLTLENKVTTKPLIDSGQMLSSISYKNFTKIPAK